MSIPEVETQNQPDSLSSGLVTYSIDSEAVFALRVSWIKWNSEFRGSGLRIGDRIAAVNGVPLAWPADDRAQQKLLPTLIGQYEEAKHWREAGAAEGQSLSITVLRRDQPGLLLCHSD
ncbi:MAG TPA: hypothetical protein VGO59_19895 [Verrucomicrobiae bacterium]